MNGVRLAIAAAGLALAGPAAAQSTGYEGVGFVEALRSGDASKALEILKSRPQVVNARDGRGDTALMVSVAERDEAWTVHLLNIGADPNMANSRTGDTALITAARIGYTDAIDWLLQTGAKVDAPNRSGETPLIIAVQQRQREAVERLLSAGANPDRTDNVAGFSARDYAKRDTRARDILRLMETAKKPASGRIKF